MSQSVQVLNHMKEHGSITSYRPLIRMAYFVWQRVSMTYAARATMSRHKSGRPAQVSGLHATG